MSEPEPQAEPLPLAEARWLWRRLYVYAVSGLAWGLLAWAIGRAPIEALPVLAHGLMMLLGVTMVLYLVAPSAQQLVGLLAEMRLRLSAGAGR